MITVVKVDKPFNFIKHLAVLIFLFNPNFGKASEVDLYYELALDLILFTGAHLIEQQSYRETHQGQSHFFSQPVDDQTRSWLHGDKGDKAVSKSENLSRELSNVLVASLVSVPVAFSWKERSLRKVMTTLQHRTCASKDSGSALHC